MNIALKKSNKTSVRNGSVSHGAFLLAAALLLASLLLLFAGCNQDGVGIFYQISQEQEQKESKISERNVYQVVEAGGELYALAGRSVFKQVGGDWSNITGSNYAYNIVADSGGTLYANINNDDDNLDEGKLWSYDGSTWTTSLFSYTGDIDLFQAEQEDAFFLELSTETGVQDVQSTADLSTTPYNSQDAIDFYDAAALGTDYFVISKDKIYSGADLSAGSLSEVSPTFTGVSLSGDLLAICSDDEGAGEKLYLATSGRQIYSSDNGTIWDHIQTISDTPIEGSLAVVSLDPGPLKYLIIGTEACYYEMEIGSTSVVGPTGTASTGSPDNFYANYPDLQTALVWWIYQVPLNTTEFYLGTQAGLWKRNSSGEFEKL